MRTPSIIKCVAISFALSAVTGGVLAATAMKDPLYGDPAHPNIAGMWTPDFAGAPPPPAAPGGGPPISRNPPARPQLTPPYAARYEVQIKRYREGTQPPDSLTACLALGVVRFGSFPMEIIQTPGQVTLNTGVLHDIRRIYMDGIGHTEGADPSFRGDSVGHWEGDTLVVETNNLRAGTMDREGTPYSDKLTVVERIKRVSPTRLEIESTLTDPEALTEPYVMRRAYKPMPPGSRFEEYVCENNHEMQPEHRQQ
jgi:hypothetical protein